jgi:hypothetical protein
MKKTKKSSFPIVPPQIINHLNSIEEKVYKTYIHAAYISRIIRDHEDEARCDLHPKD